VSRYFDLYPEKKIYCYTYHQKLGDSDWEKIRVDGPDPLRDTYPHLTLRSYKNQPIPDFFKVGPRPIVSDRFRRLLEKSRVGAEFIPIKVVNNEEQPVSNGPYWFMHVLDTPLCIDYEQSEVKRITDSPTSLINWINKLVFKEEAIQGRHLFRPESTVLLFVSGDLKKAITTAKLSGAMFTPLEEARL
jgi:hypothetical protein